MNAGSEGDRVANRSDLMETHTKLPRQMKLYMRGNECLHSLIGSWQRMRDEWQ